LEALIPGRMLGHGGYELRHAAVTLWLKLVESASS